MPYAFPPPAQWIVSDVVGEHDLSENVRSNFSATRKWRSATRTIMAANRLRSMTGTSSISSGMPSTPENEHSASGGAVGRADSSDEHDYHTADEDNIVRASGKLPGGAPVSPTSATSPTSPIEPPHGGPTLQRTDDSGAHGARIDLDSTPEEQRRRRDAAREEADQLHGLSDKVGAVEV